MAKYIGLISSDARGKLGGTVLSRARGATTIRAKGLPSISTSKYQRARSAGFVAALPAWRALSTSNQRTWNLAAGTVVWVNSLGTSWTPTGQQLWTQCFVNAAYFGAVPPSTAPSSIIAPASFIALEAEIYGAGYCKFLMGVGSGLPTPYSFISASRPINSSVNYTKSISKYILTSETGTSTGDVNPTYVERYGLPLTVGTTIAARITPVYPGVWNSGAILDIALTVF
jgi:hypothetical protein